MLRTAVSRGAKKASAYILPTIGIGAGVSSSAYFTKTLNTKYNRPAYAWWGSSTKEETPVATVTTSPVKPATSADELAASGHATLPATLNALTEAHQQPKYFKNVTTPLDRIFLKENLSALIDGTDITQEEVRVRMARYTENELKDAFATGQSRAWLQRAIEDIRRDKVILSHQQSPEAFRRLQDGMLHTEIIPVGKGVISEIHICQYQANKVMEDTYCFVKDLHSSNGSVIGVFDGHSGPDSARYCAKSLVPYLDFFKYYGLSQDFMDPNVVQIADDHYIDLAIGQQAYKALTGACLLLTQITNNTLETLWSGDCRALLVRDNTTSHTGPLPAQHALNSNFSNPPVITHTLPVDGTVSGYQGDFTELTVPHQIDLNYYEKQRLVNEHLGEADVIARDRVKGSLQPTRAFGDAHYKKMAFFRLKYPSRPDDNWFPPYITAKPDHSHYKLQPNDRYLVLSSDGLIDALKPEEVTSILHTANSTMPLTKINNLATFLTAQALYQTGKRVLGNTATLDDVSNFFPRLPYGRDRRHVHDDITVLVIKLNPDHIGDMKTDSTGLDKSLKPPVPNNLREAIKKGLLSSSVENSRGGEFLTTGITVDADPTANVEQINFKEDGGKWQDFRM